MSSQAPVLKLYNTLTREKEEFRPLDPSNMRMYVCGPTVYDHAHIGNARPLIVFDVLYRLLRHLAKQGVWDDGKGETKVTYVRNITDVDDKINARAAERGISIRELTEETNKVFQDDVKALGCLEPSVQPRATEHIDEMIRIIKLLIDSGHAYPADGHVLFDVPSWKDYGRLSRRPLDEMIAGARVEVAPYKRGDMDFVLWKPSKESEPGWDSPWGRGRPGWHIECSAMSWKHLGETFDIHGGGIDLVFPHHENEIAQSRCAFGRDVMANVWMHNGFLQVEGEKMSKSLGNFVTIRELLDTENFGGRAWSGSTLRLAMLRTHYRQPIDWTVNALEDAELELSLWAAWCEGPAMEGLDMHAFLRGDTFDLPNDFVAALSDDLNTPEALKVIREHAPKADTDRQSCRALIAMLDFLNLCDFQKLPAYMPNAFLDVTPEIALELIKPERAFRVAVSNNNVSRAEVALKQIERLGVTARSDIKTGNIQISGAAGEESNVERLIASRNAARAAKNWAESDRIRDELAAMGIALKDNKDGTTTWEVRR